MPETPKLPEITLDASDLWREEVVTDRKNGIMRMLTPITPDGSVDAARKTVFVGEAQLMTNLGALPVPFEIPGDDLKAAVANFNDAAKAAIERTVQELQDLRRQAASSLVIPPAGTNLGNGGMGGMGGLGGGFGGGKIQMP
jgi:hypothetical protein